MLWLLIYYLRYAFDFRGSQYSLVVVNESDAMIITISYKNFDVIYFFVEHATYSTGFVKGRIKGLFVFKGGFTVAKPGENFIVERVDNFYFVVVSIGNCNYVFVRDKTDA